MKGNERRKEILGRKEKTGRKKVKKGGGKKGRFQKRVRPKELNNGKKEKGKQA